ncbi:MAG TPA: carboxypeptidase-like regulatory domain-containing protein [Longimicrobiaceae bacterium]
MRRSFVLASLAALVPLLTACPENPIGGYVCTTDIRPAVMVRLADARTGAALEANGATLTVRDGAFVDSVHVGHQFPEHIMGGVAWERPGRYDVTVRKPGYREWEARGVRVQKDECHVRTVTLEARLEPAQ